MNSGSLKIVHFLLLKEENDRNGMVEQERRDMEGKRSGSNDQFSFHVEMIPDPDLTYGCRSGEKRECERKDERNES